MEKKYIVETNDLITRSKKEDFLITSSDICLDENINLYVIRDNTIYRRLDKSEFSVIDNRKIAINLSCENDVLVVYYAEIECDTSKAIGFMEPKEVKRKASELMNLIAGARLDDEKEN